MKKETPMCCPYCTCSDVSKIKDKGFIEIGPLELDQEEDYPLDVWVCSKCQRRFIILEEDQDQE